jgi:hypothetical protein
MGTINPAIKTFSTWKRVAIISFFGGLGVAVVVCALFASVLWYSNRLKQWNAQAIRAHYKQSGCYVTLEDWYRKELSKRTDRKAQRLPESSSEWVSLLGKITVQVSYDVENSTAYDYTLQAPNSAGLVSMQRLKSNGSLVDGKGLVWSLAEPLHHLWTAEQKPVLIPAHQTARIVFAISYDINGDDSVATSVTNWTEKQTQKDFARHLLSDAEAFVLLDEGHRYRIDLPLQDALR